MRNILLIPGLFTMLFGFCTCSTEQTVKLFNGSNLEGWYTFIEGRGKNHDPKEVFTVKEGLIRISGEEWGCITTENEYDNYRLVLEYKWGELTYEPRIDRARDSGVLLHSQGEDGGSQGIWMFSIECQIIEGGTGDFIVVGDGSDQFQITSSVHSQKQGHSFVFDPNGQKVSINEGRINWHGRDPAWRDTLGFRGQNDLEYAIGKWNRLECFAKGDSLKFFLNGHLVNRAEKVNPNKGRIQIQSEGAEIYFRRVDLTILN